MASTRRQAIRAAFDQAAGGYDSAAFLQQEIARRLDEHLELMKISPATILEAGCGTGYAFPLLRRRYPEARLIGLDLAPAMLGQARQHCPETTLLQRLGNALGFRNQGQESCPLVCGDLEHLPLARNSLDMVWSNVTLQWIAGLEGAFREVHRVLRPGGLFAFSTFGPDTLKELRTAFTGVDEHSHVNRFTDMHDIGDLLVYAGFANPVMEMEHITLTYGDLKSLLREIKSIGAHTVLEGQRQGLMGRQAWRQFEANYERFRREGRLPATYEVIYGHAWTGSKDRLEDGRQVIQFKIEQRQRTLK
jgi:malonyl-CoA O-methyltransferase